MEQQSVWVKGLRRIGGGDQGDIFNFIQISQNTSVHQREHLLRVRLAGNNAVQDFERQDDAFGYELYFRAHNFYCLECCQCQYSRYREVGCLRNPYNIYSLPTTNISPEGVNMIGMTWDFAQKP